MVYLSTTGDDDPQRVQRGHDNDDDVDQRHPDDDLLFPFSQTCMENRYVKILSQSILIKTYLE